jgi:hypothetical protein
MPLELHFELRSELRSQSVDYHNVRYRDNGKTTYVNDPRPARGCIFYLISYFRLTAKWSERILFFKSEVCVLLIDK